MLKILIHIILSLSFASAQGKILLVSDIDDTLKVSRAQNLFWNIINAYRSGPSFRGMGELYQLIAKSADVEIVYVTNAHNFFMRNSHSRFLKTHNFPTGEIYFWDIGYRSEHKFDTLQELLKKKTYELVVMVGDNGKADPIVYKKITTTFPQVKFKSFIRTLYKEGGTPVSPDAQEFMSTAELSKDICKLGLIPVIDELEFRKKLNREIRGDIPTPGELFDASWTRKALVVEESPCL